MQFELTKHAECVITRRGIPLRSVEHVLGKPLAVEPDKVDPALEHRLGRVAEYGNRVLRVVVNARVQPISAITVFWDRRARKKL
ncbi:MAG: DUF4258 domain-containing protein [Candidatus Coatesbacteria bacterium]|nr:DUF4258 domain-containing protein [Candidatus Coatesbacteria bacterium]